MKVYIPAIVLTVVNLGLLIFLLTRVGPAVAPDVVPVLRGKALEVVDNNGRVRAQITVYPTSRGNDGETIPDTVLFRLIDPNGRPGIKIGTSVDGSGMSLAGDSEKREWSGVQLLADSDASSVILTTKDGRVETVTP